MIVVGADNEPHAPETSLTWAAVVPANDVAPVPHVPTPWLSAQTIASLPVTGSTLKDG